MASTTSFGDRNAGFQVHTIHGPVSASFHLPPAERPETPPRPSVAIPFPRDRDFVERGAILDHIGEDCAKPGSWIALVGLGGVGKSQLAIEHAYRTHERWPETWVFWVYASNAARFEQSYRDIADRVQISGRQDPRANIFQLVHNWLRDGKARWQLILDNVDDACFLVESQAANLDSSRRPLRDYLPRCERGSILITTRNKNAALQLVEERDIILVEPMDKAQAKALLEKKLGAPGDSTARDSTEVDELAAALEYIPLAMVQAAGYILQRRPRCSVGQYLEEFKRSERNKANLLYYNGGQLRRDREAKNSIIATWEISFQYIQDTRPSAAELLSLMSFFNRHGIPEELLRSRGEQGDPERGQEKRGDDDWKSDGDDSNKALQSSTSKDRVKDEFKDGFEDDVLALRNFCFISVNTDGSFKMHALVQLATREWLKANSTLEQWKQQFVSSLCAAFPTGEYKNWARCRALFAHAKAAAGQKPEGQKPEGKLSLAQWATLLYHAAWFALEIGNISNSKELAVKSMKVRKMVLGAEHEDTLRSIGIVGKAYRLGGQWKEAKELFVQAMEKSARVLGDEHPITLASINNLASTYGNQGQWKEAEELEVQAMEARKRVLGDEHPDTLASINSLASTYWNQGRWKEAEELEVQVMETKKRVLGDEHPDTLTSMHNFAYTLKDLGYYSRAISMMDTCVTLRTKILGADHPYTTSSLATLNKWRMENGGISSVS